MLAVALGEGGKPNDTLVHEAIYDKNNQSVYDEQGNRLYTIYINETEKLEIEQQVKEFVKDIKPNLFFIKNDTRLFDLC